MIEYDCETDGLQIYSGRQKAFSMQFWDGDDPLGRDGAEFLWVGTVGRAVARPEDIQRVQYWLDRGKDEGIRAHNAKFDRSFGEVSLPELDWPGDGCWHDSLVVAQTLDENRSNALKALGDTLIGEDSSDLQKQLKTWLNAERARRKKESVESGVEIVEPTFADVPEELIVPYGLEDCFLQRAISDQFDAVLAQQPKLQGVVDFERKVMDALYAVEKRGLPCDREGYYRLREEVIGNLEKLEDAPVQIAISEGDPELYGELTNGKKLEDLNVRSSQQVIAALKACGADTSFMATDAGEIKSADKENLSAVEHPLADAILKFRSEYKTLTTYTTPMLHRHYSTSLRAYKEPYICPDERIHATYRQAGAKTGRMSAADPSIQNQPAHDLRLRYNIRAEPGMSLVCVDLSNVEMCCFAAYAGRGRLLDTLNAGGDMHSLTAKMIGLSDRERPDGNIDTARDRGKRYNFSIVYGGGLATVMRQLRVDRSTARMYRNRYRDAYPEIGKLQTKIEYRLHDAGYIEDLWGRRYRCRDANKEAYLFVNYLVQGTAAQLLKDALVDLHAAGMPVVALIHDEIIAHVPTEDAEEAKQLIMERMTAAAAPGGKFWLSEKNMPIVPLKAEGTICQRWSDVKNPEFKPKWAGGAG